MHQSAQMALCAIVMACLAHGVVAARPTTFTAQHKLDLSGSEMVFALIGGRLSTPERLAGLLQNAVLIGPHPAF